MSEFELYLTLGYEHISDLQAYDHILFIIALCAIYQLKDWKAIGILVTAFTIGHSLTLALSVSNIVRIPTNIIELLIPVTIILTCIFNLLQKGRATPKALRNKYGIALFFGLIHGMGFSNYLKQILGTEESILTPLLAFNIGLELGQLLIVAITLFIAQLVFWVLKKLNYNTNIWNIVVSSTAILISLKLISNLIFQ